MEIIISILQLLTAIVISLTLSVIAMQVIKLTGTDLRDTTQRNNPKVLLIAGFFNLLFILAVKILLESWDQKSLSVLGFSFDNQDIIFVICVFIFLIGFSLLFAWFLNFMKVTSIHWTGNIKKHAPGYTKIFLLISVLFIAALQEEILFRGYFAYILLPYGFLIALFISALIFTGWHFLTNKVNVYQATDWFLGGIMLFIIYWLSGSVWVAAIIHFSRNITNVLVFNIANSTAIITWEEPIVPANKTIYTLLSSAAIVLFALLFYVNV
jgi:membrane protease YdiL (CAAX protease family)